MSRWRETLIKSLSSNLTEVSDITLEKSVTYKSIVQKSLEVGNQIGLPKQSIISVVLPNSIDYITTDLACTMYGFIFAPIPYSLSKVEVEKILDLQSSEALITDRDDLKYRENLKSIDFNIYQTEEISSNFNLPQIKEEDVLCLYFSSGTTGNSKGIMYSHENKFELIKSLVDTFGFTPETKHLAFLPFGHTAALNYSVFPCLFLGSKLFICQNFDKIRSKFFYTLSNLQINYAQMVPTIAQILLKLKEDTANLNLDALKFLGCGSAPLSTSIQAEFFKTFRIPLANLYGLSETGPTHFDNPEEPGWQPGSIGVPLEVNECRIAEDGEIEIKGKNVMMGYYQSASQTSQVIQNGWFKTGDFGFMRDGKFYFSDRKKDIIIRGGINIFPSEVEDIIYLHPDVKECVVFGIPDELQGESIVANIATIHNKEISTKQFINEINQLCLKNLSSFKIPSIFFLSDSIPKTASGKLLRRKVRDEYLKQIDLSKD